jgi:bacterial leucyl aminopeptidase
MKQQISWNRCVLALAMATALQTGPATAGPDEVWITLGQKEAAHLTASLAKAGRTDALSVESEGEVVVARSRERDLAVLSRIIHDELHRCGGFAAHASRDDAFQAVAREQALLPIEALVDYTIDNGPVVQTLVAGMQEANVRATITSLAAFFTRYHTTQTGLDSASWIRNQWAGFAAGRPDVTVQLFTHPTATTPQPSVVLTIPGTTLPSEIVVLGAHQDSINGGATGRAPGADDDASGVASLSEVIRVALANDYRPLRTVKFMAYAAEEVGLRGSADIAAQHRSANANVVGVLQLDMTNYKGNASVDFALVTDRTNAAQNTFVGQLIDTYVGLPRVNTQCGYACSDHASWNTQGYAASFPHEAPLADSNPFIHSANDTLAQSGNNASHALKYSKLAGAYLAELAKGGFGGGGNLPPTANAGADQSALVGAPVTLAGSGSDPDGGPGPLTYAWSQVAGPSVTIANPAQATASVTPTASGAYGFRLTVSDGAAAATDDVAVTISSPGGTAVFDATLQAPKCAAVGSSCDTGPSLVLGRDGRGPEPNQPNTIGDACADGTSGTFHVDESNDRVRVFTTDGTSFVAGKTVRIEATVWAWTTPAQDSADFFYAADATNPVWTLIGTVKPTAAGAQTLSTTYTLPSGALQAVRVQYRYQGSATACASGGYNDRDDLVFAVTSTPVTTVFSDTFETATGWTANPNGTDAATAGAWERGDPEATTDNGAKQLGTTVSGTNDLVTARLAGASAGTNDVDGGVTSIQSPAIALPSSGALTLSFQYYLAHGSNSQAADSFRVFVVSGTTATQVFQSLGAASNRNGAWTAATASLSAFAGQTVRLRFEAADASTASLVEAGVDDVRITQP